MSTLTIGQGKMQIEALLRKVAEVQGVKLAGVRWRQETSGPPLYYLEATSDTGRTDDMKFSPEHLADCESDNKMKFQVKMKIEGLVIRRPPADSTTAHHARPGAINSACAER